MVENKIEDTKIYQTTRLEDLKTEKIAFVIDMYEELKNDDYFSITGEEKLTRFEALTSEIINFVKIKDYFSTGTQFALYTYRRNLQKEIKFTNVSDFLNLFDNFKKRCNKEELVSGGCSLDLTEIHKEACNYLEENLSITSFANSKNSDNELIRFILFYNRSEIPASKSNTVVYNMINLVKMSNFICDVVFLRRKMNNEEDKKVLTRTFNSFMSEKPKMWYLFENSGSIQKLKYVMNLLLANPCQRVLLVNIEKYKKKIDELITNFSPDM